jgi:hypothetical protein
MNNNKDLGSSPNTPMPVPVSVPVPTLASHKQELPITSLGEIDWRFFGIIMH